MKPDITKADRHKVVAAVKQAELSTSGEIIVVVTSQSDDYVHVPIHIAAGVALAVPFILPWAKSFFPWAAVSLWWVIGFQLAAFIGVALILSHAWFRYLVTPRRLMHKYAHRNAASQFLTFHTHATGGRTGILIFVSLLERYVEVLGDTAISAKVSQADWQKIINEMMPLLKNAKLADALVLGIEKSGHTLAKHFPPDTPNPNELPDHFIVVG
ncbi:MAG: TPM domain-containing protein [Alphaproteobacteria bacterium]|nr:TPM domain-containing protein [Alphaproteobacteria bacterium]